MTPHWSLLRVGILSLGLSLSLTALGVAQTDTSYRGTSGCAEIPSRLYVPGPPRPGVPDSVLAGTMPELLASSPELMIPVGYTGNERRIALAFQFVLDTMGRPIPCSIVALHPSDLIFVTSGREYLLHARFRPARKAGRPVPMLVQQRIVWQLR